ncbi:hypothetical protein AB0L41_04185 [Amycolatopsis mediterranei]|uniref:hypothetical protein n=1 Tax=Amycolatopsis mediterranei TaxID=33910 RepID=UPI00341A99C6
MILDIDVVVDEDGAVMDRFETASLVLMPGRRVRAEVISHHPWGLIARIAGHEQVGASVDMIEQFGRTTAGDAELRSLFPPVGAEFDAVVELVRRWSPPAWVRLSVRPADLESFSRMCDFCGQRTVLSEGGDGLVLDVRSNDGPGSHTVLVHRTCLADRIEPQNTGERARALTIGRRVS